jgi:hypothetical protein
VGITTHTAGMAITTIIGIIGMGGTIITDGDPAVGVL